MFRGEDNLTNQRPEQETLAHLAIFETQNGELCDSVFRDQDLLSPNLMSTLKERDFLKALPHS